ncbi:hypothetical protein EAL2_c13970 [Peptoclostridium acidaminophilum DSM 3953]|uniref:DUF4230 domain-containing protein n=1 Tax=Peptoclostridium acidaminophilum DSM 3953 TaxID=1286171 RepID=W8TKI8_PEPAC|nr:DUF4230 domain-containing protein [Peptoclostridium acidaminophilum]AHM56692.1 hypothetical protein EAL2_c13970 [Peptoclostridium acidaminophilum DSM 3953]
MNKSSRKLVIAATIIALLIGVYAITDFVTQKDDMKSDIVRERITSISELAVLKYEYKDIALLEDSKKIGDIELPFTQKSLLIVFGGYMKAGVDLESADIDVEGKSITVYIDGASITDNVIDEKDIRIYDEKSALFNRIESNDILELLSNEKARVEKEALDRGFLEEADKRAKEVLESYLRAMDFEDVKIEIR